MIAAASTAVSLWTLLISTSLLYVTSCVGV